MRCVCLHRSIDLVSCLAGIVWEREGRDTFSYFLQTSGREERLGLTQVELCKVE